MALNCLRTNLKGLLQDVAEDDYSLFIYSQSVISKNDDDEDHVYLVY